MKRGLALGLMSTLGLACNSNSGDTPLARREQSIISGTVVQSEELDHTGALVIVTPEAGRAVFCTATLIGAETVVTAKHCALTLLEAELLGLPVEWVTGPSALVDAVERIPVAAVALAPPHEGGFLGIGRDVAVVQLDHPADAPFIEPAGLTDEDVGQSMLSIGYGVFTASGAQDGQRRVGTEAVAALRGNAYQAIFGSFENFVEWSFTGLVTSSNFLAGPTPGPLLLNLVLPGLRAEFQAAQLLDGYEAVTGRAPGDTQTCSGDSGGPLALRDAGGTWQTYGVVSGGLSSARSVCDFGSVFAVFGPETLAFLQEARSWEDPCGDVSALGECQGALAVRCQTNVFDDVRRLIQRDCAALGQVCALGQSGADCAALAGAAPATDTGG